MTPENLLKEAFAAAVEAAHPTKHLASFLPPLPKGRLVVVGAGKAAAAMAQAVEAHYPLDKLSGLVITRYGHSLETQKIEVIEASHPVPDEAGQQATERILEMLEELGQDDLLLCLISGGGSALLCAPDGLTLAEKAELTTQLLNSGADIKEMNTVRKHLSRVKGGRLAERAYPAKIVSLILSDVVGDDLSSIASGPTVADPTSFADALGIVKAYELDNQKVISLLEEGVNGKRPESPKPNHPAFQNVENILVASGQKSLEAAARYFESKGIQAHILSNSVEGEAREVAQVHAAIARQVALYNQPFSKPCVLISGGETTVTVKHKGKGGRNGEFALGLAIALDGLADVYALAADTDGIDGSENNAGATFGPEIFARCSKAEAKSYLVANDSYSFFARAGALFETGPTHTNVNDLRLILIL
ncbi:MAG: glycerate kinase [Trueperaceae bacterium]|nr:glycerate kinase [Trueperaceae bacterium]